MQQKPTLSIWQIWNMCFGFLGIQMGFALQNANVSRIFQSLGASVDEIPILWVAAPITGLLVQPIVGYYSDRTWTRLGRRRPYFLFGAVATSAALFFMPHAPALWIAAGTLWILDASINVSMEPFRAFVGDNLPVQQRSLGFAMQSFFIGIGAIFASALPWILTNWFDVNNMASPGEVPDSVRYAFYVGGAGLFLAVLWTVIASREYPPETLEAFERANAGSEREATSATPMTANRLQRLALGWCVAGSIASAAVILGGWDPQLLILTIGAIAFALVQWLAARLLAAGKADHGLCEVIVDLIQMPRTMRQLSVVQFFSWFALFAMWIYTTAAVTSHHYGTSDATSELFNEGANWVGILFAAYNGFAALAAIALPSLASRLGRRGTHGLCLMIGACAFASFLLISDPRWLLISMVGVGIAWTSILAMPYAILSVHLPAKKMGVYMGIFNFFIVIPQITAASILGLILREVFANQSIYALAIAAASMTVAALSLLWVDDVESTQENVEGAQAHA